MLAVVYAAEVQDFGRRCWNTDSQEPLALRQLWWLVTTVALRDLGDGLLVTSGDYQDCVN